MTCDMCMVGRQGLSQNASFNSLALCAEDLTLFSHPGCLRFRVQEMIVSVHVLVRVNDSRFFKCQAHCLSYAFFINISQILIKSRMFSTQHVCIFYFDYL